ncbi:MAG: glycosyltransferase family 4 protein [Verrucomicrobia bacterium]|nr:glycosyltransferase family 4 protein [Verrucomicrobiota bacterium]
MRTLLIHQVFVSPREAGGTRHFELGSHVVRSGHEFTIVASSLSYLTGSKAPAASSPEEFGGIRVLRAYTYPALHRSFLWRVISFLSFMLSSVWSALRAGPVDVVMGTSPPIFQAASAWFVAAIRRKPFLLEIRDLWPEFAIDMGVLKNRFLIVMSRWLERFLYARATRILVNSPAYRDYLIAMSVNPAKIDHIPNGVDPDMFVPEAKGENIRMEYDLGDRFVAVYAGALGRANDLPTLLRAAERLKGDTNIVFLIVGDGMERPMLESWVGEKKLTNVLFTGAQPKARMSDFLAAADVCLATLQAIPMFKTTYPNKVFDYMAAGRATLLGIDGVIRSVMEQSGGGVFVPPGDPEAMADAVVRMRDDPARVRAMGLSARAYVVRHFNRKEHAERFVRLLVSMTADRVAREEPCH